MYYGMHQEITNFLENWISDSFEEESRPTVIYFSQRGKENAIAQDLFPFIYVEGKGGEMDLSGIADPAVKGRGYLDAQIRVSIYDTAPAGEIVNYKLDNALTNMLLRLPSKPFTDMLGHPRNSVDPVSYYWDEIERDESESRIVFYYADIVVKKALVSSSDYQLAPIRDFNLKVDFENPIILPVEEELK